MGFVSSIKASFGADTTELKDKAGEAEGIVGAFAKNATATFVDIGVGFATGFLTVDLVKKVLGAITDVTEKAKRLVNLSRELDVNTTSLQLFEKAVKKAGGEVEAAQKTWEKARKALDDLADGNEGATKNFAKLHLAAEDFLGLTLDQSLEKIARAYYENKDAAGVYAAVVELLGAKSAPALNAALLRLGKEGFGAMAEANQNLSDKLLPQTIVALDGATRTAGEYWGRFTTFVGNAAGSMAAAIQLMTASGDSFEKLKEQWGAADGSAKAAGVAAAEHAKQLALAAIEARKLAEATERGRIAYEQQLADDAAVLKGRERLVALQMELAQLSEDADSSALSQKQMVELTNKARQVTVEIKKLNRELDDQELEAQEKKDAAIQKNVAFVQALIDKKKLESLPIEAQLKYLEEERVILAEKMMDSEEGSDEWRQAAVELAKTDNDIQRTKVLILKQQTDELKEQTAEAAKAAKLAELESRDYLGAYLSATMGKVRGSAEFGNAADDVLQEIIRRDKAAALAAFNPNQLDLGDLNPASVAAGFLAQKQQAAVFNADAAAAQRELDLRAKIRSAGSYQAALQQYGGDPIDFQRIYDQATKGLTAQQQTSSAVGYIAKKLGYGG